MQGLGWHDIRYLFYTSGHTLSCKDKCIRQWEFGQMAAIAAFGDPFGQLSLWIYVMKCSATCSTWLALVTRNVRFRILAIAVERITLWRSGWHKHFATLLSQHCHWYCQLSITFKCFSIRFKSADTYWHSCCDSESTFRCSMFWNSTPDLWWSDSTRSLKSPALE